MSADETAGSAAKFSSSADFRREAAQLGRLQAGTIALQDATTFLRNTYLVSTAALARALAGTLAGDTAAAESISRIQSALENATQQYERVVKISTELLSTDDGQSS